MVFGHQPQHAFCSLQSVVRPLNLKRGNAFLSAWLADRTKFSLPIIKHIYPRCWENWCWKLKSGQKQKVLQTLLPITVCRLKVCIWSLMGLKSWDISWQVLLTALSITVYRLKGEVCLWSLKGLKSWDISCQVLLTALSITVYRLKGEVCLWSLKGLKSWDISCQVLLTALPITVWKLKGKACLW